MKPFKTQLDLLDRTKYDPAKHTQLDIAHAVIQLFEHTASDLAAARSWADPEDMKTIPDDSDDIKNAAFRDLLGDTLSDFHLPRDLHNEVKAWVAAGARLPWRRTNQDDKTFTFKGYTR